MDGALLHICRRYPIDHVVMYMSKDILEKHNLDNRYLLILEALSDKIGRTITYEIIERGDLVNVHKFDFFIDDFRDILQEIYINNPEATLYLNVSSGTPAMKSALQILSVFREVNYIPIQVSGPGYRVPRDDFVLETAFKKDLDNHPGSKNRCELSSNMNLLNETKKKMISALIDKYDYSGALLVAKDMDCLSDDFVTLLEGADLRYKYETKKASQKFNKVGYGDLMCSKRYPEYLLILWVKYKKDENADFLRALTPYTFLLFKKILEVNYNFNVDSDNYTVETKDRGRVWSYKKIKKAAESDPAAKKVLNILSPNDDNKNIYSSQLVNLINTLSYDEEQKKLFNNIRKVEKEARNEIAHKLKSFSMTVFKDKIDERGFEGTIDDLFKASIQANIISKDKDKTYEAFKAEFFDNYDRMNDVLKALLDKNQ